MSDTPHAGPSPIPPPDPNAAPAGADPVEAAAAAQPTPPTAVDLHVKLGPLQDPGVARPRAAQVWAWALAGGGLAGLASWLAGEYALGWFVAETDLMKAGGELQGQVPITSQSAMATAVVRNAALAFGLLGALTGGLLGIAGGMVRPSLRAGLAAGALGAALGVAAAVGSSLVVLPVYARYQNRPEVIDRELLYASLALGAVWAAVGAAGGTAFGAGMGGWKRAGLGLVGGALGGLLGAAAFEMIAAVAFPLAGASQAIPTSREARLVARGLAALFISAGVAALVAPTRFEGEAHGPAA